MYSGLERRDYGRKDPSRWPRGTLYPQKLALILLTSGGRSVGIVGSRTKATEFVFLVQNVFFGSVSTNKLPKVGSGNGMVNMAANCFIRYSLGT
jgi:hypothetical protein